jgi:hypothetical protein
MWCGELNIEKRLPYCSKADFFLKGYTLNLITKADKFSANVESSSAAV